MKQTIQKRTAAMACMVLLCMGLLCGTASAATLVVIDLADMVDEISPSVVEVFTVSAPVIKCKKTPRKKCNLVAERRKKR